MGWTTKEEADYLETKSVGFISRLCKRGILKATIYGRDWDIDPELVKAYKIAPKNKGDRPKK